MTGRERSRRAFLGTVGTVGAGLLAGCSVPLGSQVDATAAGTPPARSPYTRVYRETVDSVVLVQVTGPTFGSQGSGFVFDDAGRVLTNQHVVADAERIDLRFADGRWRRATVLGTDVYSDLAVLKIQGAGVGVPALPFVEATPPIGTEVVAIGSPYGLEGSLSVGVVSGANRAIPTSGGFSIPDAVQTDAAVNPGNSGGPLVTLDGTVVGVIRSGGGENIGFAISAALVRRVTPALVEGRRYEHPYLGIGLRPVTPPIAEANDLDRVAGVMVTGVVEGGPSDGVLRGVDGTELVDGIAVPVGGDVIVGIADEPVPTSGALGQYLALETRPGRTVELTIVREGRERTVSVTLGSRPPP